MKIPELVPVGPGRHPDNMAEGTQKIGIIVEAALEGNGVQAFLSQHPLTGKHDPAVDHVFINAAVRKAGKLVGKIGGADVEHPGETGNVDGLRVMGVDIQQHILNQAVGQTLAFHGRRLPHGIADQLKRLHHPGAVPETAELIRGHPALLLDLPETGDEPAGGLAAQLIGIAAGGGVGTEVGDQIDLAAAETLKHFRGNVQEGPIVVLHFLPAVQPVHEEGRKNKNLIRAQGVQMIVHAHELAAVQMQVEFKIVVAVVLGDLHVLAVQTVGFIPLRAFLHGFKGRETAVFLHMDSFGFQSGRFGHFFGFSEIQKLRKKKERCPIQRDEVIDMIRVAVIGTGNISHAHIGAYLRFPERCKIVALVDIIPGKAQRVKEQYHLDAEVFLDHHEILDREIDLFDICTPPFVHAEIAVNALRAGHHVVCEKPMAASLEECDAMLRARDESGRKLSIIAQNRFREPIRNLKALLDSGLAGKIRAAEINSFWFRGHSYYDLWWRGTWEKEGGGCTLNHAVHHIDMLGWMMGTPERVTSVLANVGHDNAEVEDLSVSVMEYPGALATVTASVVHHGEDQSLTFQCEKAKLAAPYEVFASIPQPNGFPLKEPDAEFRRQADALLAALPPIRHEMHEGQLENVLTALETGGEVAITGEDGRRTIELITAIYKAGSTRIPAELPLKPEDPFYTVEGIRANAPHFYEKSVSLQDLDGEITFGSDLKNREERKKNQA